MDTLTPLIISGAPRSGTSLLYNLFDAHPEVSWLVDEGFLFEYLDDLGPAQAETFLAAVPDDIDALIDGIRDKQIMPPMHIAYRDNLETGTVNDVFVETPWDEARFRAALAEPRGPGIAGLWHYLAAACLKGEGAEIRRYACMKAPDHAKSARAALAHIDDARAIVILREPLHSLDSLKRSRELRGDKLLTWPLLAQATAAFNAMWQRIREADPARLKVIRYEDLTAAPEATMRGLAGWLGIAFDPTLLKPTMRGQDWPGISSFAKTDGIDTAPTKRAIQALTAEEADFARDVLAGFRAEYGFTA